MRFLHGMTCKFVRPLTKQIKITSATSHSGSRPHHGRAETTPCIPTLSRKLSSHLFVCVSVSLQFSSPLPLTINLYGQEL